MSPNNAERSLDSAALADFIAGRAETFTGKELRFLRHELGLNTFEAAEAIGLSPQEISRIERVRTEKLPPLASKALRDLWQQRPTASSSHQE